MRNKTSALGVKKIISLALSLFLIIPSITSAAPFDIFDKYYPDFLISNVWQDNSSKDIYVKICNVGGSVDAGTMSLGVKKSNGVKSTKTFQNVNIYAGGCVDYRAFSLSELSISSSGNYTLTVGVIIKSNKSEKNLANNISSRNIYINAPLTYFNTNYNSNYYYNDYNSNYNKNIDITYPAGGETFSNNSNNYINLRAQVYANSNNIRYINIYFIKQSPGQQYKYERMENISYNYGSSNPFEINKTFYVDNWPTGDYYIKMEAYDNYNNVVATDITRSFRINDSNYYYNNNYNNNYYNNYNYSSNPDLTVREITQDSYNSRIYAKVCNIGANMTSSSSLRFDFTLNGKTVQKYASIYLNRDGCTSDLYVNISDFNQGNYYDNNIGVTIDTSNNLYESNENNNYFSQNINTTWSRSDLLVDSVVQNTNNRTLTVKICNRGASTLNNQNWNTRIYNNSNGYNIIKTHSINLGQNSCIEFDTSYAELGISYASYGFYEIKVETDTYNSIYESNEENNSYTRGFNY